MMEVFYRIRRWCKKILWLVFK